MGAVVALLHITSTSRLLTIMKEDNRAIFTAAARAQEAVTFLATQHTRA
jgi:antirestriction protein ArdC